MPKPSKTEAQVALFRRLDFAVISFRQSRDLCIHLRHLEISPDSNRDGASLYSGCVTGIVVTYGLPFTQNGGLGSLPPKFRKFPSEDMAEDHRTMLLIRDTVYAHRDLTKVHNFVKADASLPKLYTSRIEIRRSECGEGAHVRSFPVLPDISETCLPKIQTLLDFQIERLNIECDGLVADMAKGKTYLPGVHIVGDTFP